MSLPFNLQRLPPEAISVLGFLGRRNAAATTRDMDDGLDIGSRAIGRAIRRLVNYSLIQMDFNGAYQLTGDGRRAYQQLAETEAAMPAAAQPRQAATSSKVTRRLTVVLPQSVVGSQPVSLYIGINPPAGGDTLLTQAAHVELRLSATGADLSNANVALDVPPDKAADPAKVTLAVRQAAGAVRVRIDAFQSVDIDRIELAGGMYFDIPVLAHAASAEATRRAVGVDLTLG